jgi:hypothetical protein
MVKLETLVFNSRSGSMKPALSVEQSKTAYLTVETLTKTTFRFFQWTNFNWKDNSRFACVMLLNKTAKLRVENLAPKKLLEILFLAFVHTVWLNQTRMIWFIWFLCSTRIQLACNHNGFWKGPQQIKGLGGCLLAPLRGSFTFAMTKLSITIEKCNTQYSNNKMQHLA